MLNHFRVLFPSWRFFEGFGRTSQLFYRLSPDGENFGDWEHALKRQKRRWSSLFLNSDGNLLLACHTLVEQLVNEIEEMQEAQAEQLPQSVSYQLVEKLVRFRLRHAGQARPGLKFQFKVKTGIMGSPHEPEQDSLISRVHEI